jgi:hypothetical protein
VNERDDIKDALKTGPEEVIPENFIGEWEYIDAEKWNTQQQMVSIGAFARYEPYAEAGNVLKLTLYKPRERNVYPGLNIVYVFQQGGIPLMRQYVLDNDGYPDPEYGFRMTLPIFDYYNGQYLCWTMDLMAGEMQLMVKRSGPTPKLKTQPSQPAQTQAPATSPPGGQVSPGLPGGMPSGLTGVWDSGEGEGIVFQGNQWAYFEDGQMVDGGIFQIQGNQLFSQSNYTGEAAVYLFQVSGNRLIIQDTDGGIFQFFRSQ